MYDSSSPKCGFAGVDVRGIIYDIVNIQVWVLDSALMLIITISDAWLSDDSRLMLRGGGGEPTIC